MGICENVQRLCKKKGLPVSHLEKELSLANGSIRRWNESSPSADKLQKVAEYFNVSTDYLLGYNVHEFFKKIVNEFKYLVNEILQKEKLSIIVLSSNLGIDSIYLKKSLEDNSELNYNEFKLMIENILDNAKGENSNEITNNYFFDFTDLHEKMFKYEYNRPWDELSESFLDVTLSNKAIDDIIPVNSHKEFPLKNLAPKEERDIAHDPENKQLITEEKQLIENFRKSSNKNKEVTDRIKPLILDQFTGTGEIPINNLVEYLKSHLSPEDQETLELAQRIKKLPKDKRDIVDTVVDVSEKQTAATTEVKIFPA